MLKPERTVPHIVSGELAGQGGGHAWVTCCDDAPGFLWISQAAKKLAGVLLDADGWRGLQVLARDAERRLRPVPWWRRLWRAVGAGC